MTSARSTHDQRQNGLPKHVLLVMNGASGGAAMSTLSLVEGLVQQGIRSSIYCLDAGSAKDRSALTDAVEGRVAFGPLWVWNRKIRSPLWKRPLIEAMLLKRTGLLLGSTKKVLKFIEDAGDIDFVHTTTSLTPEGAFAAKILGLPHLWHIRELIGPGQPFRFYFEGPLAKGIFSNLTTLAVANSPSTYRSALQFFGADQLRLVNNGIDLESFKVARSSATLRPYVISMIASTESRMKRHELFIEAASRMTQRLSGPQAGNVEFRIYGYHHPDKDAYAKHLECLVGELGLRGKLHFAGHHPPQVIMSETSLVVHPAHQESFGRIAVEAMAAGLPVIGFEGGGVADIVRDGETGILLGDGPDNADTLAGAMQELFDRPDKGERYGNEGRAVAEREYSVDSYRKGMAQVYEETLRRWYLGRWFVRPSTGK